MVVIASVLVRVDNVDVLCVAVDKIIFVVGKVEVLCRVVGKVEVLVDGITVVGKVDFSVKIICIVVVDGVKVVEEIVVGAKVDAVARKLIGLRFKISILKNNLLVVGGIVDFMVVLLKVEVVNGGKVLASIVVYISGNSKS